MSRTRLLSVAAILAVCLAPVRSVFAKGPPDRAVLQGPGLKAPVEITDQATLAAFSFFQFEQVETNNRQGIPAPKVGAGYELTRYTRDQSGTVRPWDVLHYYPNPSGQGGVIFLDGLIGPSYTEFDGKWYPASQEGDAAIRRVLADNGVSLGQRSVLPATGVDPSWELGVVLLAWLLVGLGACVRNRHHLGE